MRIDIHHYIHQNGEEDSQIIKLIKQVLHINQNIMGKIEELNAKADALQAAIDETQDKVLVKIATLEATVQELKDQIANGGNDPALQAIADKLDAATADLRSTFPEEPQP